MRFDPTETQALVAKTAREFAARVLAPQAADRDRTEAFPEAELRELGAIGLLGMCVPERWGGADVGPLAQALAVREVARVDASVAVTMAVTNMVAEVIFRFGSDEARDRLLPALCDGRAVAGAFALSEPQSGSDAAAMRTTARRRADGYVVNGAKQWITSGDRARVLVIMARHGDDGPSRRSSAFVVERGAPGLSAGRHERKMGQRGSSTVPLALDDVPVPAWGRLGEEGDGMKVALSALDGGRINVGALAIGVAEGSLAVARRYVKERRQFDRRLADFQAVQMMLADAATALDAAWLLVSAAAWHKEERRPMTRLAAEAKLFATERAVEVCDRCVQLLGGYGYAREYPVERHLRDVRVTTIYEGTSQIQRLVIAKQLLKDLIHA